MRIWSETQGTTSPVTKAAPLLVTEGMSLVDVQGYRVFVAADVGKTLSGSGTLQAYVWDDTLGFWMRSPELDVDLTVEGGVLGARAACSGDVEPKVRGGRVYYAATGVDFDSGSAGLTVGTIAAAP